MKKELELRMYGFVPYNISDIQKGIQFGHAVVEYELLYGNDDEYKSWAKNWKTFIILNGGTSNHTTNRYLNEFNTIGEIDFTGSMEKTLQSFSEAGIKLASFNEPDLNDMLSGIVFIVDERVFNWKEYPGFLDWIDQNPPYPDFFNNRNEEIMKLNFPEHYKLWLHKIGGEKNAFLKKVLPTFRLA
jgi:hypothetical protein